MLLGDFSMFGGIDLHCSLRGKVQVRSPLQADLDFSAITFEKAPAGIDDLQVGGAMAASFLQAEGLQWRTGALTGDRRAAVACTRGQVRGNRDAVQAKTSYSGDIQACGEHVAMIIPLALAPGRNTPSCR